MSEKGLMCYEIILNVYKATLLVLQLRDGCYNLTVISPFTVLICLKDKVLVVSLKKPFLRFVT